jgi:hypothetical protein
MAEAEHPQRARQIFDRDAERLSIVSIVDRSDS